MFPRVMAARVPRSLGKAEDSQKATSPGASLALGRACVAMNDLQRARVAGSRAVPDGCHAEGSLAPVGRKPGHAWNLARYVSGHSQVLWTPAREEAAHEQLDGTTCIGMPMSSPTMAGEQVFAEKPPSEAGRGKGRRGAGCWAAPPLGVGGCACGTGWEDGVVRAGGGGMDGGRSGDG